VQRSIELVDRAARDKRTELAVDLEPRLAVQGDAEALEQVLVNLLDNAVKYSPESARVELRGQAVGRVARIEVRDNGPGIEPRHRERIFERFYRVDPGRSRDMGGTGLGLSIVRHLVQQMGGAVGVDPAEPHGAVFWIELPVARADEPATDRRGDAPADPAPGSRADG